MAFCIPTWLMYATFIFMATKNVMVIQASKHISIIFLILFPILITVLPICFIMFSIFWMISQTIIVFLKIKYGAKFCGLAHNLDVLQSRSDDEYRPITLLWIVEYDKDQYYTDVLYTLRNTMARQINDYKFSKLFSSLHTFMGFTFFVKQTKIDINEYIKELNYVSDEDDPIGKKAFLEFIDLIFLKSKPLNEDFLWECFVGTYPINWNNQHVTTPQHQYPIIICFNRSMGDISSFIQLFTKALAGARISLEDNASEISEDINLKVKRAVNIFKRMFYMLLLFPASIFKHFLLNRKVKNAGQEPSDQSITIAVRNDDDSGIYFRKLDQIKQKLLKYSFDEIMLTIFSESIQNYFEKHSSKPIEYLSNTIPLMHDYQDSKAINLINGTISSNYVNVTVPIPCSIENHDRFNKDIPLISRLKILNDIVNDIKECNKLELHYVLERLLFSVLPLPYITYFCKIISNPSTSITILPISSDLSFGDLNVIDCNFWTPVLNFDLTLSVTTYNNRLQCTLLLHSKDENEGEKIITNIFKSIDLLEGEVNSLSLQ